MRGWYRRTHVLMGNFLRVVHCLDLIAASPSWEPHNVERSLGECLDVACVRHLDNTEVSTWTGPRCSYYLLSGSSTFWEGQWDFDSAFSRSERYTLCSFTLQEVGECHSPRTSYTRLLSRRQCSQRLHLLCLVAIPILQIRMLYSAVHSAEIFHHHAVFLVYMWRIDIAWECPVYYLIPVLCWGFKVHLAHFPLMELVVLRSEANLHLHRTPLFLLSVFFLPPSIWTSWVILGYAVLTCWHEIPIFIGRSRRGYSKMMYVFLHFGFILPFSWTHIWSTALRLVRSMYHDLGTRALLLFLGLISFR